MLYNMDILSYEHTLKVKVYYFSYNFCKIIYYTLILYYLYGGKN